MIRQFLGLCILTTLLVSCSSSQENVAPPVSPVQPSPSNSVALPSPATATVTSYSDAIDDLSSAVKKSPAFNTCLSQQVNMCASSSVNALAQEKSDAEICKELSDAGMRNSCTSLVVSSQALREKDEKKCDALEQGKEECRMNVIVAKATEAKNVDLCVALRKKAEVSTGTGVPQMAPMMDYADSCIMRVISSSASPDAASCDKIQDKNMMTMCQQNVKMQKEMIDRQKAMEAQMKAQSSTATSSIVPIASPSPLTTTSGSVNSGSGR